MRRNVVHQLPRKDIHSLQTGVERRASNDDAGTTMSNTKGTVSSVRNRSARLTEPVAAEGTEGISLMQKSA